MRVAGAGAGPGSSRTGQQQCCGRRASKQACWTQQRLRASLPDSLTPAASLLPRYVVWCTSLDLASLDPCHTHQKKCGQPQNSSVVTQAHAGESASGGSTARGAAGDPRLCGTRSRVQRSARFPSFLLGRGCLAHRAALIAAAAQRDLQLRAAAAVHALPAGTGKVGRRSVCRRTAGIVQVRVQPHDLQPRASTPTNNGKHTCLRAWLQLPPKRKEQQLSPHTAPAPAGCAAPPAARAAPCPGQPAPVGEGGRAGESSHEL